MKSTSGYWVVDVFLASVKSQAAELEDNDGMSSESVLKGAGAAQPLATRSTRTAASTFEPFIPASARLRELTAPPLIVGTLLGIIFGASSLYLVLKVGLRSAHRSPSR